MPKACVTLLSQPNPIAANKTTVPDGGQGPMGIMASLFRRKRP